MLSHKLFNSGTKKNCMKFLSTLNKLSLEETHLNISKVITQQLTSYGKGRKQKTFSDLEQNINVHFHHFYSTKYWNP